MPGPYPGRVVEVQHAGSVTNGHRNHAAIKMMIQRGMQQLVPEAETAVDAWRRFFQLGDRVGIKVVPVGMVHKPGADRECSRAPWSISGGPARFQVMKLSPKLSKVWLPRGSGVTTSWSSNVTVMNFVRGWLHGHVARGGPLGVFFHDRR